MQKARIHQALGIWRNEYSKCCLVWVNWLQWPGGGRIVGRETHCLYKWQQKHKNTGQETVLDLKMWCLRMNVWYECTSGMYYWQWPQPNIQQDKHRNNTVWGSVSCPKIPLNVDCKGLISLVWCFLTPRLNWKSFLCCKERWARTNRRE